MNTSSNEVPFKQRLLIFAMLWLLAGAMCAFFVEIVPEAGENVWLVRCKFIYLAPLVCACGVSFEILEGHYDTAQQRDFYHAVTVCLLMAVFVAHAFFTLTRRTRRQFLALIATQAVFLAISVACVLHLFHYLAVSGP